jgi:hypothetical protein
MIKRFLAFSVFPYNLLKNAYTWVIFKKLKYYFSSSFT